MSTADLRKRLVELDAAILEQKLVLDGLQRDKTTVQRELSAISTFPVSTGLPVEITTEIFAQCLPTIEELREDKVPFIPSTPLVPLVLLGVCRVWRDIALAAPVLWTTVVIPSNIVEAGAFVDRWLGRAALLPLSIIYHAFDVGPAPLRPLRDVIHQYAHRIEYLELSFSPFEISELELDSVVLPLLQRATFGIPEYCSPGSMHAAKILGHAPQLRAVVLLKEARLFHFTLPCLQLTKFEGEIDTLGIFRMAPNLIEVKCAVGVGDFEETDISHPRLKSLTVTVSSCRSPPTNLLDRFTLPALHSLHVSGTTEATDSESLADFFRRSAPPLRTLSINVDDCTYWEWSECFSCIANTLENLEVVWALPLFVDRILHLGSPASGYHPLPHLQSLAFVHSMGVTHNALVHFLHNRSLLTPGSPPRFRSFRFNCPHGTFLNDEFVSTSETSAEITADLAAFVDDGLDLCIPSGTRLMHHSRRL
ncbi:hypothetical protein DFH08DRAFT_832421, partial [Mycena albidolilacea]